MDPGSPYNGWIIGGLFVLAVIAATFAFLGRDTKTVSITTPDRGAPASTSKSSSSTTGVR
jgi:hypothetical protein